MFSNISLVMKHHVYMILYMYMFDTTKYKGDDSSGKGREKCNNHFCVCLCGAIHTSGLVKLVADYPPVNIQKAMENHHLQ